jgi:hypothetical protein
VTWAFTHPKAGLRTNRPESQLTMVPEQLLAMFKKSMPGHSEVKANHQQNHNERGPRDGYQSEYFVPSSAVLVDLEYTS